MRKSRNGFSKKCVPLIVKRDKRDTFLPVTAGSKQPAFFRISFCWPIHGRQPDFCGQVPFPLPVAAAAPYTAPPGNPPLAYPFADIAEDGGAPLWKRPRPSPTGPDIGGRFQPCPAHRRISRGAFRSQLPRRPKWSAGREGHTGKADRKRPAYSPGEASH